MIALAVEAVSWTARHPKSVIFRVAKPHPASEAAGVAGIGSRHRVAPLQPPIHRRVDQRSREATVADALVFAVPRRRGGSHTSNVISEWGTA